jgi:hypothetical protein
MCTYARQGRLCKLLDFSCVQLLAVMRRETWVLFETAPFDHSGTPPTNTCRHFLVLRGGRCSGLFQTTCIKHRLMTKNFAETTAAAFYRQGGEKAGFALHRTAFQPMPHGQGSPPQEPPQRRGGSTNREEQMRLPRCGLRLASSSRRDCQPLRWATGLRHLCGHARYIDEAHLSRIPWCDGRLRCQSEAGPLNRAALMFFSKTARDTRG